VRGTQPSFWTSQAEVALHRAQELQEINWQDEEVVTYADYLADFLQGGQPAEYYLSGALPEANPNEQQPFRWSEPPR